MPVLERAAVAGPEGPEGGAERDQAAWDALAPVQRARAEAWLRQEAPALARRTGEQGPIWRLAVLDAVRGQPAGQGDGDGG